MMDGFRIERSVDISIADDEYFLHTHKDKHEILLFLDGDCEFHVEGTVYKLSPGDLVIASTNELHRIIHKSAHRYERYIIYVETDFFAKNNCTQYAGVFESKLPGQGNLFKAPFVRNSEMIGIIEKILYYHEENEELVAKGALFELLYKLCRGAVAERREDYNSEYVKRAVAYINDHLSGDLSLKKLSEQLHISHEYLTRLFQKQMKLSIKRYITYKRLLYVRQLYRSGENLLEASLDAGFSSYSNFYRMYVRQFGESPSRGLKNK